MNYWLSRDEAAAPEGPYLLDSILGMRERGEIGSAARVCPEDEESWRSVDVALAQSVRRVEMDLLRQRQVQPEKKPKMFNCCSLMVGVPLALLFFSWMVVTKNAKEGRLTPSGPEYKVSPSVWDGSVSQVETFVKAFVRDPSSVKFNEWSNREKGDFLFTEVDFTAANGFGGAVRNRWLFSFNRITGELLTVMDKATGESVLEK